MGVCVSGVCVVCRYVLVGDVYSVWEFMCQWGVSVWVCVCLVGVRVCNVWVSGC